MFIVGVVKYGWLTQQYTNYKTITIVTDSAINIFCNYPLVTSMILRSFSLFNMFFMDDDFHSRGKRHRRWMKEKGIKIQMIQLALTIFFGIYRLEGNSIINLLPHKKIRSEKI